MNREGDPFAHAEHTARTWLDAVMGCLGTTDRRYAYRVLRAWLHVVRDRLTVDAAAHLGAQLPELLRGVFYEGWRPSDTPKRYDKAEFIGRFAADATIAVADVPHAVACVSSALRVRFSPGTLDHALSQLPPALREFVSPTGEPVQAPAASESRGSGARLDHLERMVASLTDTVARIDHRLAGVAADRGGETADFETAAPFYHGS
jgi:uncharacterized protein (DUF2267 family)